MPQQSDVPDEPRRSWLRRHISESIAIARGIIAEPRTVGPLLRGALLGIWRIRGGGFYGLGYLVCFVVLEVRMFVGDWEGSDDVVRFVIMEAIEVVFRFTVQSFVNGLLAFAWPAFIIDKLDGWGLLGIAACWVAFDRWGKARVEAWFPELKAPLIKSAKQK